MLRFAILSPKLQGSSQIDASRQQLVPRSTTPHQMRVDAGQDCYKSPVLDGADHVTCLGRQLP